MIDSVVPEAVRSKWALSKLRVLAAAWLVIPDDSVLIDEVEVSEPQENLPEVASQRSLEVAAVSQSVRPEPLTPPLKLAEPVTEKRADRDTLLEKREKPSKAEEPSTSRSPEMRRSLEEAMEPAWVVVAVPSLL